MDTINTWFIRYSGDSSSAVRLFCFHFAGGSATAFRSWTKYLSDAVELIAIQLPARDGRYHEPALTNLPQLVTYLTHEITPLLNKPYIMFGHSLGALIGYELIRSLTALKISLPKLFMPSAHRAPHLPAKATPIYTLPDRAFIARLGKFEGTSQLVLENEELMAAFLPRIRADFQLLESYVYRHQVRINTPILALMGRDDSHVTENELLEWEQHTRNNFRYRSFDGDHFYIKSAEESLVTLINSECEKLACGLAT